MYVRLNCSLRAASSNPLRRATAERYRTTRSPASGRPRPNQRRRRRQCAALRLLWPPRAGAARLRSAPSTRRGRRCDGRRLAPDETELERSRRAAPRYRALLCEYAQRLVAAGAPERAALGRLEQWVRLGAPAFGEVDALFQAIKGMPSVVRAVEHLRGGSNGSVEARRSYDRSGAAPSCVSTSVVQASCQGIFSNVRSS